jgi:hypothetical protein
MCEIVVVCCENVSVLFSATCSNKRSSASAALLCSLLCMH